MKRPTIIKHSRAISTDFKPVRSIFRLLFGLLIYSFGIYLTIYANIGFAPWDCFAMGIANHTPLNYGESMMLIGVCAIVIQLILHERIGFATIIDALLTGNMIQLLTNISPYPENNNKWLGVIIMLFGFLFISLGMYVYMKAELGCGPKDGLMIAIGKRLPKMPIGVVEILLWLIITLIGYILGGSVGIGTLISIFGAGAVMNLFYTAIHFDPRKLRHRSIKDTFSILFDWG